MKSVIAACITGMVTFVGVILSNTKSGSAIKIKPNVLTESARSAALRTVDTAIPMANRRTA